VSLRARLLIVTVALVAAGLLVANVATYRYLSRFMLQRIDQQLVAATAPVYARLAHDGPGDGGPDYSLPGGSYGQLVDPSGDVVNSAPLGFSPQGAGPAVLPDDLPGSSGWSGPDAIAYSTARPFGEGGSYRVRATALPGGGTIVVATPLTEMEATLRRLVGVELFVSLIVLGLVAGLALWLVRIGLQPLEGIGETAGAIAAGDMSRRVEPAEERTEVGRLGLALNAMLAQIEAAFEERRRSEERLRRFVGDASHELRTPLTSIRGYAELFRRGAESRPEDLAKSMARIEEEASRMGVLVDDLLLLARLDQGRPLEREPVDLATVATAAVEAARAIEPGRSIELDAEANVELVGDEGRLRQVIDNLLDNARVHTPLGSPVHVRVATDGDEAVLDVADAGPGMAPEIAARVFERFYRGDPARSRDTGGAGLGLSIVAAIVESHGGTVRALSHDGPGTTFEVRLPRAPQLVSGSG
jgi:two-component system, OmpR family, sensor kinase